MDYQTRNIKRTEMGVKVRQLPIKKPIVFKLFKMAEEKHGQLP